MQETTVDDNHAYPDQSEPGQRSHMKYLQLLSRIAWAAMLLALPITSFPYFPPAIGGDALVRPLSVYPMLALFVMSVVPRLFKRPAPRSLQPLLLFILIAAASSLLSLLRGIEPALGISVEARVLRGLITLMIGVGIYLAVALQPEDVDDLRFTLRWIYAGGAVALLWGSLQAIYIVRYQHRWFSLLESIQRYVSIRPLRSDRVCGLTYEPHWFADQIILLFLPWLLAAVIQDYSIFRWRWRRVTVEFLLTIWCVLLLPFTFSRAGILNLMLLSLFGALLFWRNMRDSNNLHSWASRSFLRFIPVRALPYFQISLVLLVVSIPIYAIGTRNAFFARIWEYWRTHPETSLGEYLTYLGFDARLTYSQAAFETYRNYPILGVGLGNYAFYFEEMLPYRPIAEVPEALHMITPQMGRDRLVTSKNYYLRLMSETGIMGTIAFLAFFITQVGCGLYLWLSSDRERRYWGTASLCALTAFMLSALTFDSFVIPNMWVAFGVITAATHILSNHKKPV